MVGYLTWFGDLPQVGIARGLVVGPETQTGDTK